MHQARCASVYRVVPGLIPSLYAAWAGAVLLVFLAQPAAAQEDGPRLPVQVVQSPGNLTPEDAQKVREYIDGWVKKMHEDPAMIGAAKGKLLEPYNNIVSTPAFKTQYANALITGIKPCMKHESALVRLNAIIVGATLRNAQIVDLVTTGLEDKNFAVRYWSAKGLDQLMGLVNQTGQPPLDDAQQAAMLAILKRQIPAEQSGHVLEQLYRALARFTIAEARTALLDSLKLRVAGHAGQVSEGIRADRLGIEQMQRQMVFQAAQGRNVSDPLKQLTIVAALYAQVVADALLGGKVPQELEVEVWNVADASAKVMKFAMETLAANSPAGEDLDEAIRKRDAALFKLRLLSWVGESAEKTGALTKGLAIPFDTLKPPAPAEAPAANGSTP